MDEFTLRGVKEGSLLHIEALLPCGGHLHKSRDVIHVGRGAAPDAPARPDAGGATALVDRTYGHDKADRRTSERKDDPGAGGATDRFFHDAQGRIVKSTFDSGPGGLLALEYRLDGAGNRREVVRTRPGAGPEEPATVTTETYAVNAVNAYTNVHGAARTYDKNGNLTDDGVRVYTYDAGTGWWAWA